MPEAAPATSAPEAAPASQPQQVNPAAKGRTARGRKRKSADTLAVGAEDEAAATPQAPEGAKPSTQPRRGRTKRAATAAAAQEPEAPAHQPMPEAPMAAEAPAGLPGPDRQELQPVEAAVEQAAAPAAAAIASPGELEAAEPAGIVAAAVEEYLAGAAAEGQLGGAELAVMFEDEPGTAAELVAVEAEQQAAVTTVEAPGPEAAGAPQRDEEGLPDPEPAPPAAQASPAPEPADGAEEEAAPGDDEGQEQPTAAAADLGDEELPGRPPGISDAGYLSAASAQDELEAAEEHGHEEAAAAAGVGAEQGEEAGAHVSESAEAAAPAADVAAAAGEQEEGQQAKGITANLVSTIRSFLPMAKPAPPPPAAGTKKPAHKLKALEAADAARRKETERAAERAKQKVELERLKLERTKVGGAWRGWLGGWDTGPRELF